MAKIHKIKRRIKSVGKIQQITKAMERVAASKMRRAQQAALRSRSYAISSREILAQLFLLTDPSAHPLFDQRSLKRRLLVVFSSDRGLAGAYNSNLNRFVLSEVKAAASDKAIPRVIVIGRKGASFCVKLEQSGSIEVIGAYTDWPDEPTAVTVQPIAQTIIEEFTTKKVDAVSVIFTDFISSFKQVATVRPLLPVQPEQVFPDPALISTSLRDALFEPGPVELLAYLVPRLINIELHQTSLEAAASEQSLRMVAMKNASDNAADLQEALELTYNGARQSAITQELAEISAGVEAVR
ncbi:MAG: ATP synthase F1 subunit gamma [Candidatus Andersenbacteria bacterium RIFCSPLOWO2_02_FULL_46_11]|nr:MAG: ATP synthase gamma chain [Parcubacteria group bacterium GW2011_GWA2_45_14]OGY34274.1 MAG: ATP synthase F1 subunit gamma [Candidatus Andersenbacteria bacterium RIFCSPHIGHO2_02_FULL_46_16]OGY36625.1 MAG: ATP synthase F1 subunit gamma [Candidatus Andersenbacteria bacterium RIFCSPLOWO2_02_FULL_46_11]